MKNFNYQKLPIVYSCSGCSSAAQLANHIALELDYNKEAEMSCIAGVGAGVKSIVKLALSGRPILAIDGCPLNCVKNCLKQVGVVPTHHVTLTEHGIEKKSHQPYEVEKAKPLIALIKNSIKEINL